MSVIERICFCGREGLGYEYEYVANFLVMKLFFKCV